MLAKNQVIDLLIEYATNKKLFRIVEGDGKIRAARIYAEEKYTTLETAACLEFLTYQQGLKDMFNLIISLQNEQGEQA